MAHRRGPIKDAEVVRVRPGRRTGATGTIAAMLREDLRAQVETELGAPLPVHLARLANRYAVRALGEPAYAQATIAALRECARYCYRPLAALDHERAELAKAELARLDQVKSDKPAVALYRLPDNGRVPPPPGGDEW